MLCCLFQSFNSSLKALQNVSCCSEEKQCIIEQQQVKVTGLVFQYLRHFPIKTKGFYQYMYYWEITFSFSILTPTLLSGVFMCTCHAGCKEVSTGDRFDGDTRLPLQEPRDKLGLHLLQSTRQRSFATAHSGRLSQWHIKSSTVLNSSDHLHKGYFNRPHQKKWFF